VKAHTLQTENIRKEYPGTLALDNVSVSFEGGKIHALLGKNGAGKSTLIKILSGTVQPTAGRILLDGREIRLRSAQDAFHQGVATVYQELSLVAGLTVAENILLGRWPKRGRSGDRQPIPKGPEIGVSPRSAGNWCQSPLSMLLDWPALWTQAQAVLDSMHVALDVHQKTGNLGVAQQQIVEIAKAMSFSPSVLMLDEPTSALAQHETENLFQLLRKLAAQGVAIVYITHRLQEVPRIADQIVVLRDGRLAGALNAPEARPEDVVRLMFGEVIRKERPRDLQAGARTVLAVRHLSRAGSFQDVSFELHEGEILGIAGMLGSGRTELLRAIFGADRFDEGEIAVAGHERDARGTTGVPARAHTLRRTSPELMKALGVAFTPEERQQQALVQCLSTRANLSMSSLGRIARRGVITRAWERSAIRGCVEQLAIHIPDLEMPVSSLSGGNQQKVVVGKWLNTKPKVILLDEPTRGIDVQAKQQVFQILWDLSRQGIGSVVVSSELEELLEVCHRVLVMKKGAITGEVRPHELSADELYVRCMGA